MSERDKMAAGDWYNFADPELETMRRIAQDAMHEHNFLPPAFAATSRRSYRTCSETSVRIVGSNSHSFAFMAVTSCLEITST
jgi:hypothetical protein